jgi:hypothetical protein
MNEVKQLLNSLSVNIFRSIRTPGDQQKAFNEIITKLKSYNISCQNCAEHIIKNNYESVNIKYHLNNRDETKFWGIIERKTNGAFSVLDP